MTYFNMFYVNIDVIRKDPTYAFMFVGMIFFASCACMKAMLSRGENPA